jgi:hypothetical protein
VAKVQDEPPISSKLIRTKRPRVCENSPEPPTRRNDIPEPRPDGEMGRVEMPHGVFYGKLFLEKSRNRSFDTPSAHTRRSVAVDAALPHSSKPPPCWHRGKLGRNFRDGSHSRRLLHLHPVPLPTDSIVRTFHWNRSKHLAPDLRRERLKALRPSLFELYKCLLCRWFRGSLR